MAINCLYCQRYVIFKLHHQFMHRSSIDFRFSFLKQTDEIDGALLGALNGRNSQSHIDAINRQLNLTLPATPPSGLSQQQLKRRHIFAAIVHSECSYVATLQRLVNVSSQSYKCHSVCYCKKMTRNELQLIKQ